MLDGKEEEKREQLTFLMVRSTIPIYIMKTEEGNLVKETPNSWQPAHDESAWQKRGRWSVT